jgi:hypothetical protein
VSAPEWYEYKIDLFQSVTLPSIAAQAREKFYWMIAIDSSIPIEALKKLRSVVSPYSFIHLVTIDPLVQTRMLHGGFANIYERCQDYLLANGLIEDPGQYVITSLIDDDDAWNRKVVDCIDRRIEENAGRLSVEETDCNRGYLLRHSTGMFLTFEHGILWDVASERYEIAKQPSQSMSVFVFARFSSNISACTVRHGSWPSFVTSVGFETHVIGGQNTEPMWIYLRHPRAISQIAGAQNGREVTNEVMQKFALEFSIDPRKLSSFIGSTSRAGKRPSGTPDNEKFELLDLQFRISAYRRQIKCLTDKLDLEQFTGQTEREVVRLRQLRSAAYETLGHMEERFRMISRTQM